MSSPTRDVSCSPASAIARRCSLGWCLALGAHPPGAIPIAQISHRQRTKRSLIALGQLRRVPSAHGVA